MLASMSAPAWPWHNAVCESEEIYCYHYGTLEELLASLKEFIDRYYNGIRLHSALGYQSPEGFERRHPSPKPTAQALTHFRFSVGFITRKISSNRASRRR